MVAGNCGYSIAPTERQSRGSILRTLDKVEDMRLSTLEAGVGWDFETYPEYLQTVARRGTAINFGGYVGHTPVRIYVMGDEAYEREATADEIARMRQVVKDSLLGGALGFSSDRGGFHLGDGGRPVPSIVVDPGRARSADVGHRRDRPGHDPRRPGRALPVDLRLPAEARPHHHLVGDPHLPEGHRFARRPTATSWSATAKAAGPAPTSGSR